LAGTNSLEIEIHNLFQEGTSVDYVCEELLNKYDKSETLSAFEIEGLSHFLISAGRFNDLKKLYTKCLKKSKLSQFPIGFLVEALEKQNIELTEDDINLFEYVIEQQPTELTALHSEKILSFSTTAQVAFQQMPQTFQKDRTLLKTKLIEQLNQNRMYQLVEQEEAVLAQILKLFPNDIEIGLLKQAHLEKKADHILSRVLTQKKMSKTKSGSVMHDPESATLVHDLTTQFEILIPQLETESPEQLYNLAILTFQFEMFDLTLKILDKAPKTSARDWLKAETLLECGRFLDLLKLIETIESDGSADSTTQSEVVFGATYLKALAYKGLGQKDLAIHLLESLSITVPSYRSTEALLHEWKNS
jgi:tetratricopeptide (TPR) repeat protein